MKGFFEKQRVHADFNITKMQFIGKSYCYYTVVLYSNNQPTETKVFQSNKIGDISKQPVRFQKSLEYVIKDINLNKPQPKKRNKSSE